MILTIQGAAFANAEHTAAVLQTLEAGAVLASAVDTPELWAAMLAQGTPAPYEPPHEVPEVVSPFQARAALMQFELLDDVTALMADPATPLLWALAWDTAQEFRRHSPLVLQLMGLLGLDESAADLLFTTAAGIEV